MKNRAFSRIKSRLKHTSAVRVCVFVVFVFYACVLLLPYVFGFLTSLREPKAFGQEPIATFPHAFYWKNYVTAWKELAADDTSVPMMFVNSLWYSVGTCFFSLLFSAMGAYVVAKYDFRGKKIVYGFALVTMIIPIMGSLPSQLRFNQLLGAENSRSYVLFNAQILGTIFIVLYSTFKGVSWGYAEAAFIDGAGDFTVFFRIMLPQVISPMCALFLTNFIWLWADSETPMIFFDELPTLAYGLYEYSFIAKGNGGMSIEGSYVPVFYAGMILCMVPSLALFAIFQNTLMNIQMGGGLKG